MGIFLDSHVGSVTLRLNNSIFGYVNVVQGLAFHCMCKEVREGFFWFPSARPFVSRGPKVVFFLDGRFLTILTVSLRFMYMYMYMCIYIFMHIYKV